MNKLKGLQIYLAGSIDKCPNLGMVWREKITPILKGFGLIVNNPMDKNKVSANDLKKRAERILWKKNGNYKKLSKWMKGIRKKDLELVDRSDLFLIYLDLDIFTCGSFNELFRAVKQNKQIFIVCKQGKQHIPDWLFGMIDHQFMYENFESMFDYLSLVDKGSLTHDRWLFMDR